MRFVSPLALGLMLALGGIGIGASQPALAAKAQSGAPKLKLSPAFLPLIMKANEAVSRKDVEATKVALAAAEPAAVTPDDKYQYYAIMLNLSMISNDATMQSQALAGMLDTGLVPDAQQGQFNAIAARGDLVANNYDSAIARGQRALAAGYDAGEVNATIAQAYWSKAGTRNLTAEPARTLVVQGLNAFRNGINHMKTHGQVVPGEWYQIGVGKAEQAGLPEIRDWAQMAYDAGPSGGSMRTLLRVFQRLTPTMSNRENLDLLRLMSYSGGMAVRADYLEYAEMAFKAGLFGEVQSSIDAGRAKAVLKPADGNDFYALASSKIAADKASLGAAEADAAKSPSGKVASATGDAFFGYGNYAKAATLYRLALQKAGTDPAEVNTHLGIALVMSGDVAGAKEAFAKVAGGTRGEIAKFWQMWLATKPTA